MRASEASHTAADNALLRALDARHDRVANDQLAQRFLPPAYRLVAEAARIGPLRTLTERVIDWRWPGPRRGVVARTRFIDDLATAHAPDQLLLLGAGFDTRAQRLSIPTVYEVDHPATQAAKRRKLTGHRATFVPVDFTRDDLTTALKTAGFDPQHPTLVIWEGVTNYLDAPSVDATFAYLADALTPGTPVVFTYVDAAMLHGAAYPGAAQSLQRVRRQDEPFTWSLHPHEAKQFLDDRGFDLVQDVPVPELVRRFYGVEQTAYAYYHVVEATRR